VAARLVYCVSRILFSMRLAMDVCCATYSVRLTLYVVVPVQAMKAYGGSRGLQLHTFLKSTLDCSESSASDAGRLMAGETISLYGRLSVSQS